jgi:methylenetetrahydrofolate reductase (NADPH)
MDCHQHATGLQEQVNNFNEGITFDGSSFTPPEEPFLMVWPAIPKKHEESPNMESEIYYTKMKVDNGAEYLVTQMFFDNSKYFDFVKRCREVGSMYLLFPGSNQSI